MKSTEAANASGNRPMQTPILVGGRPTSEELLASPPEGLDRWALGVWEETVPVLAESGLIDRVDRGLLEHYCRCMGRAREIADYLQWEEDEVSGARKPRPVRQRLLATTSRGEWTSNPLLSQERAAGQEARLAGELLGLNPVGRAKLKAGLGAKKPAGSGLKSLTADLPDGNVVPIEQKRRKQA